MLGVDGVNSVDLSESGIENIPDRTFHNQTNLVSITVRDGTKVDKAAFSNCYMLRTVNGTLGDVGQEAFKGCHALTSIKVDGGVGNRAFEDCINLSKAWIMGSVDLNSFAGCTSLRYLWVSTTTSVTWRDVLTYWVKSLQDEQNPSPGVPPTSPEDNRNLQVHYSSGDEYFRGQFHDISGVIVGSHPDCDGSDWEEIMVPPALNSGLASLLLGL